MIVRRVRWRRRIGEEGGEWLLTQTIRAGQKSGLINEDSVRRVAVNTAVIEKNIAYRGPLTGPTGERLRPQHPQDPGPSGLGLPGVSPCSGSRISRQTAAL